MVCLTLMPTFYSHISRLRARVLPFFPADPFVAAAEQHSARRFEREDADDGNCFYRAIARQVYGDASLHAHVRTELCDFMAAHRDDFAPFVATADVLTASTAAAGDEFEAYLVQQRRSGAWGGELEMRACAQRYRRQVYAYQPASSAPTAMLTVHRPATEGVPYASAQSQPPPNKADVAMCFENKSHWNSLVLL
jgi:hypothetical protein